MLLETLFGVADQKALRGHYRLARVVSVNNDKKGVVKSEYSQNIEFPQQEILGRLAEQRRNIQLQSLHTVLHLDVRRIVISLPVEEQNSTASDTGGNEGR